MNKTTLLKLLIMMLMYTTTANAKSYYNTAQNAFGGLYPHPGMRMAGRYKAIEDQLLIESNATMATAVCNDTTPVRAASYRYQLRMANLNNKAGKTRTLTDPQTRQKVKLANTQWGLVFNHNSDGYWAVMLSCDNTSPYDDLTDQRVMTVALVHHQGRNVTTVKEAQLTSGVALEDGMNTICVDVDERSVRVSVGKNELKQVIECDVPRPTGEVEVGYVVGPGARVAIERAVLTMDDSNQPTATITWTQEALDQHLEQSSDPMEGYWRYLDREMEDQWLRMGGRYTLAVVSNDKDGGYDLIYVNGAQVKKSLWQPGMVKGHIKPTIFNNNYEASWIDATMQPIDKDVYANVENGVILTIEFPVYKSQLRFSKVLNNP